MKRTVAFIESHVRTACVKLTDDGYKMYELKTALRKVKHSTMNLIPI
jgi:hypothetical protein